MRLSWRSAWLREKRSLALIRLIKIGAGSSEHPSPKQSTRSLNLSASHRGQPHWPGLSLICYCPIVYEWFFSKLCSWSWSWSVRPSLGGKSKMAILQHLNQQRAFVLPQQCFLSSFCNSFLTRGSQLNMHKPISKILYNNIYNVHTLSTTFSTSNTTWCSKVSA